jgi:hypothetical protein
VSLFARTVATGILFAVIWAVVTASCDALLGAPTVPRWLAISFAVGVASALSYRHGFLEGRQARG